MSDGALWRLCGSQLYATRSGHRWIGSRTQWNVSKDLYMGFDVLYAKLNSASTFDGLNTITNASNVTNVADTDNWQFRFRVHRDFYP